MYISLTPGAVVVEMWTLMADSLLTGLPSLVKPTGSFSETNRILLYQEQTSFLPCSYLSTFQFMSPFISRYCFQLSSRLTPGLSWKKHVDFWQLAGFFLFCFVSYQHATILWSAYEGLFEAFLHLSERLGQHQRPHITGGAEFNWEPLRFKHHLSFSLFPSSSVLLFLRSAAEGEGWRAGGKGEQEEEAASLPAFVSIMCHGRSWLSCSVWLSLLLQQSLFPRWKSVSLRGRRRSLLSSASISAQLSVAGFGSHLADTGSSADTSSLHGLSWLTGSCQYGWSRRGHTHCSGQSPSLPAFLTPLPLPPLWFRHFSWKHLTLPLQKKRKKTVPKVTSGDFFLCLLFDWR